MTRMLYRVLQCLLYGELTAERMDDPAVYSLHPAVA